MEERLLEIRVVPSEPAHVAAENERSRHDASNLRIDRWEYDSRSLKAQAPGQHRLTIGVPLTVALVNPVKITWPPPSPPRSVLGVSSPGAHPCKQGNAAYAGNPQLVRDGKNPKRLNENDVGHAHERVEVAQHERNAREVGSTTDEDVRAAPGLEIRRRASARRRTVRDGVSPRDGCIGEPTGLERGGRKSPRHT